MQGSSIQNVFDQMFNRFHSRTQNPENSVPDTPIEDESLVTSSGETKEHGNEKEVENACAEIEVINVCDSDDDCDQGDGDDVVFVGQTLPLGPHPKDNEQGVEKRSLSDLLIANQNQLIYGSILVRIRSY